VYDSADLIIKIIWFQMAAFRISSMGVVWTPSKRCAGDGLLCVSGTSDCLGHSRWFSKLIVIDLAKTTPAAELADNSLQDITGVEN
jgi:hypothetical protein